MPKIRRDNAYFLERLERDHPTVFADLRSGRIATARQAFIIAGLRKAPKELNALKRAWTKATPVERRDFLRWLRPTAGPVGTARAIGRPIVADRYLEPWAKVRIQHIMTTRHLSSGDVMDEISFSRLNASLAMALQRNTRLRPDMIAAIEKWLIVNAAVP